MNRIKNLEFIKIFKTSTFFFEDGESYQLDFKNGLTKEELNSLKLKFPNYNIDNELIEILKETKGWEGCLLNPVFFDSIDEFGFIELLPHSITLGHDGFGNFWVLEIKNNGNLGKVFFASHDPAVFVIFSENLNEFLFYLNEFYLNPKGSYLDDVHEVTVFDIWKLNPNIYEINEFRKNNSDYYDFLTEFTDENWIVADLRNGKIKDGFAWGRFGPNQFTKKHPEELIWVLQKKKKGFFAKLFGK